MPKSRRDDIITIITPSGFIKNVLRLLYLLQPLGIISSIIKLPSSYAVSRTQAKEV